MILRLVFPPLSGSTYTPSEAGNELDMELGEEEEEEEESGGGGSEGGPEETGAVEEDRCGPPSSLPPRPWGGRGGAGLGCLCLGSWVWAPQLTACHPLCRVPVICM